MNDLFIFRWMQVGFDYPSRPCLYYMPLLKAQGRQYSAKWVAIYCPESLRKPGAVTCCALVKSVEVVKRSEILTPWSPHGDINDLQVLYHLDHVKNITNPIENRGANGRGRRFSKHRWTSRLALTRAEVLEELLLETEPEWRLYEDLRACRIGFRLEAGSIITDKNNPTWRVWFVTENGLRIRYASASGFIVKYLDGKESNIARSEEITEILSE